LEIHFLDTFVFVFKNAYLPFAILGYELLTGHSIISLIIGIAAGHTYIVLKDILPNSKYKYNFLATPKFIQNLVVKYGPSFANNNFGGFQQQQNQQPGPQNLRFFQGRGVRLG